MMPFAECTICGGEVSIACYVHVHVDETASCDYVCWDCWRELCMQAKKGLDTSPTDMQAWWTFSDKS